MFYLCCKILICEVYFILDMGLICNCRIFIMAIDEKIEFTTNYPQ